MVLRFDIFNLYELLCRRAGWEYGFARAAESQLAASVSGRYKRAWANQGLGRGLWKRWKLQLEVGEAAGWAQSPTSPRRATSAPQRLSEWLLPWWGWSWAYGDPGESTIAPPQPASQSLQRLEPWPPIRGPWQWTNRRRRRSRWVDFSRKRVRGSGLAGDHPRIRHSLLWSGRVWDAFEDGGWSLDPELALFIHPPPGLRKSRWVLPWMKSPAACLPGIKTNCRLHSPHWGV